MHLCLGWGDLCPGLTQNRRGYLQVACNINSQSKMFVWSKRSVLSSGISFVVSDGLASVCT